MKNLILDFFLTISGIGAASGLVFKDDHLYLISDNSQYLYDFSINDQLLSKILLDSKSEIVENIKKSEKPDFEAITFDTGHFYIYGSGSTLKRNNRIQYQSAVAKEDLTLLYKQLQTTFGVDQDNFNIEGAIHTSNEIWLFNRGNGEKNQNGVFRINKSDYNPISFTPIKLPLINDVQSAFTDAVLVNETIYFIAAAEDAKSNYLDGEIAGTIFGRFKIDDLSTLETRDLPGKHKFEGITLKEETDTTIKFLLCEDRDDEKTETIIYSLSLEK